MTKINWSRLAGTVLQELQENPGEFRAAQELLLPATNFLHQPLKELITNEGTSIGKRNLAISLLGELLRDSPTGIAELICSIDSQNFPLVNRHVERLKVTLVPPLLAELRRPAVQVVESGEELPDEQRIALATKLDSQIANDVRRRATASAWLFRLGRSEELWPLLRLAPDSSLRYALIDGVKSVGVSGQPFVDRLDSYIRKHPDGPSESGPNSSIWSSPSTTSEMQIVILMVGELAGQQQISESQRDRLLSLLSTLFQRHPSPCIHSSSEWTLRNLGAQSVVDRIEHQLPTLAIPSDRDWYLTSQRATLAVIRGPVVYRAGSDWTDPERLANKIVNPATAKVTDIDSEPARAVKIVRDFAIGLKEVSLKDFLESNPAFQQQVNPVMSPSLRHPANRINWYSAAQYCNWLSQQEGIERSEWCFLPNEEGRYAEGMTLAPNYLDRTGYRLPTEAEWEYACRAGTSTPRFFGRCRELMPQYVWYHDNSHERNLIIPGTLKPNDLGLFDPLGNVIEWCIEPFLGRQEFRSEMERDLNVDAEALRILRGGHLYADANNIRASELWTFRPIVFHPNFGFRLARTLKIQTTVSTN